MSDDREHLPGDVGDEPAPDAAHSAEREEPAFQSRPFRGWTSAREEEPSVWSRIGKRVSSMFGRGEVDAAIPEAASADAATPTEPPAERDHVVDEVDAAFASVEEALPAPPMAFLPVDEEPAEPKPGVLSRLFRRSRDVKRRSLEIEIHEDRIAAAADAIDVVGEQAFAESKDSPIESTDPFASVDEALPDGGTPAAATEPDFGSTLEFIQEQDSTPLLDFGATQDMQPEVAPSDVEVKANADAAAYFGDTLDPEVFGSAPMPELAGEEDKDTDEFLVITSSTSIPVPPPLPDLDEDTAKVSRKSLIEHLLFWRSRAKEGEAHGTTVVEAPPAFLFSKFRTFYNEIIRFKHQKTEFTAGFSTAIVTEYSADLSPDGAADALSKKLAAMLELQAAEAMWMGGESAERYPDAQYAMTALADETFLNLEWEGQGAWHKNLLEVKLFKTRCADVELFKRIDKLLKDQPDSNAARDLARVYLLVLAAGFRGKYRPFGLTRALAEYRQRLYEYIHLGGDALLIYAPDRRIFPEASQRTLEGQAVTRFTAAQRWAAILAFLAIGYTVVAHMAWNRVSADLKDVAGRIEAGATTPTTP